MKNSSNEVQRIISSLVEYLKFQEEGGLEWLQIPKESLMPLYLKMLKNKVQNCHKCILSNLRTHTVFGEGNPKAKLMFIGEAPGAQEDILGQPFIGKAGELFNRIIEAIDLSREQVYITSVIKCRPPDNRVPKQDEIAACKAFLLRQIQIIRPDIICTLGSTSTQALLVIDEPITKLRGRFHQYLGISVMPTFHPAYLLRNPQAKKLLWDDMQKIQAVYKRLKS